MNHGTVTGRPVSGVRGCKCMYARWLYSDAGQRSAASNKGNMAAGVTIEILDLRHFAAPVLRPVLDAEGELWSKRLHWDYRASARLLMQYLDNHLLPGYAALEAGQVTGYAFCVYEETKAVIGDVFALPGKNPESAASVDGAPEPAREIESTLLRALV